MNLEKTSIFTLMKKYCDDRWVKIDVKVLRNMAEFLTKKFNAEQDIKKKLGNITLVRASLERQINALDVEEEKLQELCPHLSVKGMESTSDEIVYHCKTCGSEVKL